MKAEQKKVTQGIVDFIQAADIRHFPHEVIHQGKRCLIDGIGLLLAGSTAACSRILRKYIESISGKPECTILGETTLRAPARFAALANGTSGHAHDYDDTQLSNSPDRISRSFRINRRSQKPAGAADGSYPPPID